MRKAKATRKRGGCRRVLWWSVVVFVGVVVVGVLTSRLPVERAAETPTVVAMAEPVRAVAVVLPTATAKGVATTEPTETATATATATRKPSETTTATRRPTATVTATRKPTATATVTRRPTATATATRQPTATARPTSTATALPTATAVPVVTGPVTVSGANLRAGPGTEYAVAGGLAAGAGVELVGQNSDGSWLQTADGLWVSASLVGNAPAGLPVTAVQVVAAPAATVAPAEPVAAEPVAPAVPVAAEPVATAGWQKEQQGYIFRSDCACDQGDVLNCGDFGAGIDAQGCYLRCLDLAGRDVHRLDGDKDGAACEWSW